MSSIDHIGPYSITHAKLQTRHLKHGGKNQIGLRYNTATHKETKSVADQCVGVAKEHVPCNVQNDSLRSSVCVFVWVKQSEMKSTEDVGGRGMLPNSFSVPTTKRIRQAIGDKFPLFTSGTQRGTLTDSNNHTGFNTTVL